MTDARISGRTDTAVVIERLLSISGEDSQTIDRKHREEVTLRLPTRFMVVSNELPKIHDASGALAGRLILLELTRSFYGEEDPGLFGRLEAELPGILRWSVEGWSRLRLRGRFSQPDSGRDMLEAMEELSSPTLAFLRDRCHLGTGEWCPTQQLYLAWKTWCLGQGREHHGTLEVFGRDLRAAAPGLHKSQRRWGGDRPNGYLGVRLLTEGEMAAQSGRAGAT